MDIRDIKIREGASVVLVENPYTTHNGSTEMLRKYHAMKYYRIIYKALELSMYYDPEMAAGSMSRAYYEIGYGDMIRFLTGEEQDLAEILEPIFDEHDMELVNNPERFV